MSQKRLGEIIREERKKQGLTQLELAAKVGLKSTYNIGLAEHDKLPAKKLGPILAALGINGKKSEKSVYTVYTDGGCEVNPGGRGGYGAVIINDKTGEYKEISGGFISSTNNRMEVYAVISALKEIPEGSRVRLYSDSQYVINTIDGLYRKQKNKDLWRILDRQLKKVRLTTFWVQGHTGDKYNETCDRLATNGYLNAVDEDKGYDHSSDRESKYHTHDAGVVSSMSVTISAPPEEPPVIDNTVQYAEEKQITKECAKSIKAFYNKKGHRFSDYKNLKTYGLDKWSRSPMDSLTRKFPEEYISAEKYFTDQKDIASVLRWKARGLTLTDSIRKVLVDREINQNCIAKKTGKTNKYRYR